MRGYVPVGCEFFCSVLLQYHPCIRGQSSISVSRRPHTSIMRVGRVGVRLNFKSRGRQVSLLSLRPAGCTTSAKSNIELHASVTHHGSQRGTMSRSSSYRYRWIFSGAGMSSMKSSPYLPRLGRRGSMRASRGARVGSAATGGTCIVTTPRQALYVVPRDVAVDKRGGELEAVGDVGDGALRGLREGARDALGSGRVCAIGWRVLSARWGGCGCRW